jgi:pimeloyl-ACP methyl ester carboxylesterase
MPRVSLSGAAARLGLAAGFVSSLAACTQPLTLTPSDASTVLAHRTITAPNPGDKGPMTVKRLYYGSGKDKRRAEYRDSVTYKTGTVDASPFTSIRPNDATARRKYWGFDEKAFPLNARLFYPLGPGPFPVVLIVHGNHEMREFSDPGYEWLAEQLASHGFIAASIDENFLNEISTENTRARGWMLLKHLEALRAINDTVGKPLSGRVDLTRVALIGHSRGGEAAAVAAVFNRLPANPDDATRRFNFGFGIRAVVAIGTVDGQYKPAQQPIVLTDVSYLAIHGSHDGDISDFEGLMQYNRVRYTRPSDQFKSAIWMYRANHGQWNTVWNNKDNGKYSARAMRLEALVSGEQQRQFGRVVIGGFLEATLHGKSEYRAIFQDHRAAGDWLPPTMYLTRYADARTTLLATFDEDVDVSTGSLPGVRITADSLSLWKENDVLSRSRQSFRSNVATVGWNNTPVGKDTTTPRAPARFVVTLSDSLRSAIAPSANGALMLTIGTTAQTPGPRRGAPRDTAKKDSTAKSDSAQKADKKAAKKPDTPKPDAKKPAKDTVPPDLTVELADAAGHIARLPLSTFGPVRMPIETYLYRRAGRDKQRFGTLSEPVMQTYRAPFAQFVAANKDFDPVTLTSIRLVFDRKRVGAVMVDDIAISR